MCLFHLLYILSNFIQNTFLILHSLQLQQLQQQLQQQVSTDAQVQDLPPPPPSPPPKPKQQKLPPNWKTAKDAEGKTYFYHTVTRYVELC